jgi:hypothetical protein
VIIRRRSKTPAQASTVTVASGAPAQSGPDMQQLRCRYPPRALEPTWRITRLDADLLRSGLVIPPFLGCLVRARDALIRQRSSLVRS